MTEAHRDGQARRGDDGITTTAPTVFAKNEENRLGDVGCDTPCRPYGLTMHRDRLAVADSGDRSVMLRS